MTVLTADPQLVRWRNTHDGTVECPLRGEVDFEQCLSCDWLADVSGHPVRAVRCDLRPSSSLDELLATRFSLPPPRR